jgi:hypothetical protein
MNLEKIKQNLRAELVKTRTNKKMIDQLAEHKLKALAKLSETKRLLKTSEAKKQPVKTKALKAEILKGIRLTPKQKIVFEKSIFPSIVKDYRYSNKLITDSERKDSKAHTALKNADIKDFNAFHLFLNKMETKGQKNLGRTKEARKLITKAKQLTTKRDIGIFNKSGLYTGLVSVVFWLDVSDKRIMRTFILKVFDKTEDEIKDMIANHISEEYFNYIHIGNIDDSDLDIEYALVGVDRKTSQYKESAADIKRILNSDYIGKNEYAFIDDEINESKFIKLPDQIQANESIIKVNCVWDTLNKLDKEVINNSVLTKYFKDNNITKSTKWNFTLLANTLTALEINHKIFSRFGSIIRKKVFNPKKHYFYAIVSNNHLYNISYREMKMFTNYTCKDRNYNITNVEPLIETLEYYNNNYQIKNASINVDTNSKDLNIVITKLLVANKVNSNNCTLYLKGDLYDIAKFYETVDKNMIISSKFSMMSPLIHIAERYNLFSTFTKGMNRPKPINMSMSNMKYEDLTGVHSLDLNSAYLYILQSMDYIPVINETTYPKKYDNHAIVDTNFYIIDHVPHKYRCLIQTGITSGYRLNDIEGCKISYYIEPILIENPFKVFIKKMYDTNKGWAKQIISIFIGNMQRHQMEGHKGIYFKDIITNENEMLLSDHDDHDVKIGNLHIVYKEYDNLQQHVNTNMLPCAHFVIDQCTLRIRNFIKSLPPTTKVLGIKTDCVIFKGNLPNIPISPNIYGGFKEIPTKLPKKVIYNPFTDHEYFNIPIIEKKDFKLNTNVLLDCIAGAGKTYFLQNTVIPMLKQNNKSFFVTSSQWNAIVDYDDDITSMTKLMKTSFVNGKHFHKYDYILIDEIGLLNSQMLKWLYEHKSYNQYIIGAGDKNQLLPVKDTIPFNPLKSKLIQRMFDCKIKLTRNRRNNYTEEQYKEMRNNTYITTDYEHTNIKQLPSWNISYTNDTRKMINNLRSKNWTDKIGKLPIRKGARIICITNNLKPKNIYNKQIFYVQSYSDNNILLKRYNKDIEVTITYEEYINFDLAYCLTLYCVQGLGLPHGQVGFHDINYIKEHVKNGLYVMYSRIEDKPQTMQTNNEQQTITPTIMKENTFTISF